MRAITPLAALTAMISLAIPLQGAHAQVNKDQPVPQVKKDWPEIKPAHPDHERLRRWMEVWTRNEEIKRLRIEYDLRKGNLDNLKKRKEKLPNIIKEHKDWIIYLKKPIITHYELIWRSPKGTRLSRPYWPWDKPEANLPLIIYDWIERWIPEYERYHKERLKRIGKYEHKYNISDVWRWAIPREQAHLRKLEVELGGFTQRIEMANQALSEVKENLKKEVLKASKNSEQPGVGPVIDAGGDGKLFDKKVTRAHLVGCGNGAPEFTMKNPSGSMARGLGEQIYEYMGFTMPRPGLTGGKRVDFQKACNEFSGARPPMTARVLPWGVPVCWRNDRKWRPPKHGEAGWGINGAPLTGVCYEAYFGQPAIREERANMVPLLKYTVRSLHVECFYLKRAALQKLLESGQ